MPAFRVADVGPDTIMQVVVNAATRAHVSATVTTVSDIERAVGISGPQAQISLAMAVQLRLLSEDTPGQFYYRGNSNLRNSPRSGLPQFFREAVQQFPPFLFYISFLARAYSQEEASRQTSSIFGIGLDHIRMATIFKRWAKYAGIMDEHDNLDFTPNEMLDLGFLARLHDALKTQISTQTFVLEELGSTAGDFYNSGLDMDALARALITHHDRPEDSIREASSLLETYLAPMSVVLNGPGVNIAEIADFLAGKNQHVILKTHKNLSFGVAGFRNAADHGADPDTGQPWHLTGEAALVGSILVLITMKSVARYLRNKTQEV